MSILPVSFSVEADKSKTWAILSISSVNVGERIYYTTDGSTPSEDSKPYVMPLVLNETTTIKAIAVRDGLIDSDVAEITVEVKMNIPSPELDFDYSLSTPEQCTIRITNGNEFPEGTRFYWDTDNYWPSGQEPTENKIENFEFVNDIGNATFYVLAYYDDINNRQGEITIDFLKCQNPQILFSKNWVTMTCYTEESEIWYTTDDSDPSTSSTAKKYEEPIKIWENTTFRACAKRENINDSSVMELDAVYDWTYDWDKLAYDGDTVAYDGDEICYLKEGLVYGI